MYILPLFQKRRSFFYDRYLTSSQNFENLAHFENWDDDEYDLNYEEFQNQNIKIGPYYLPFFENILKIMDLDMIII